MRARRVGGLALLQYRAAGQHHGIERLRLTPGGPPALPHVGHRRDPAIDIAGGGDPAGAELRGQAARPRPRGRDVKRDRVARVDQPELGVKQPDQPLFVFDFGLDRLSAQQRHDDADIFLHIGEPDGAEPHRPPPGKPGADPEIDPPPRQFIQRCKGVRGNWGNAVRWDQHAGAEPDLRRLDCCGGHRDKRIGAQHLRIVKPGAGEAQFLGPPHHPPGIGVGRNGNTELHYRLPDFTTEARRPRRLDFPPCPPCLCGAIFLFSAWRIGSCGGLWLCRIFCARRRGCRG